MAIVVYDALLISIHTPVQGVTYKTDIDTNSYNNFNPHSRAGSDTVAPSIDVVTVISIHTPVQGVTKLNDSPKIYKIFQSTLPCRE